jgi:hypothetical protein
MSLPKYFDEDKYNFDVTQTSHDPNSVIWKEEEEITKQSIEKLK